MKTRYLSQRGHSRKILKCLKPWWQTVSAIVTVNAGKLNRRLERAATAWKEKQNERELFKIQKGIPDAPRRIGRAFGEEGTSVPDFIFLGEYPVWYTGSGISL